ncbi:MAG: Ig-like domain-containing protein [Rhodothalassiaceae bacterium]
MATQGSSYDPFTDPLLFVDANPARSEDDFDLSLTLDLPPADPDLIDYPNLHLGASGDPAARGDAALRFVDIVPVPPAFDYGQNVTTGLVGAQTGLTLAPLDGGARPDGDLAARAHTAELIAPIDLAAPDTAASAAVIVPGPDFVEAAARLSQLVAPPAQAPVAPALDLAAPTLLPGAVANADPQPAENDSTAERVAGSDRFAPPREADADLTEILAAAEPSSPAESPEIVLAAPPAEQPQAPEQEPAQAADPTPPPAEQPQAPEEEPAQAADPTPPPAEQPQAPEEEPAQAADPTPPPAEQPQAPEEEPAQAADPTPPLAEQPQAPEEAPAQAADPTPPPAEQPQAPEEAPVQAADPTPPPAEQPQPVQDQPVQAADPTPAPAPVDPPAPAPLPNQAPLANQAPQVSDVAFTLSEESGALTEQVAATDPEGGAVRFTLSAPPEEGAFTLDPATGTFSFSPAGDFEDLAVGESRTVAVTVTASDAQGASTEQILRFTVTGTNDAPVAGVVTDVDGETSEIGQALGIALNQGGNTDDAALLSGADVPSGALTVSTSFAALDVPNPSGIGAGLLSYTVDGQGDNALRIVLQSGGQGTELGHVSVFVNGEEFEFVSDADLLFDGQEHRLALTLDPDTDTIALFLDGAPLERLGAEPGDIAPIPTGGTLALGQQQSADGDGLQSTQLFDGFVFDLAVHNGVRPDAALAQDATNPGIEADDPTLFTGFDFRTGSLDDVTGRNGPVVLAGSAGPVPVPTSQAVVDGFALAADGALTGQLTGSDIDGDPLSFGLETAPDGFSVAVSADGRFTVQPGDGFDSLAQGEVSRFQITTRVEDGQGGVAFQDHEVTIFGVNDAPSVAAALSAAVVEGDPAVSVDLLAGATDVDGDTDLTLAGLPASLPAGLSLSGTSLTIDAQDPAFDGLGVGQSQELTLTFDIVDSLGASVPQSLTVTISGQNDAPVLTSGPVDVTLDQNGLATGDLTAADADGSDSVRFVVQTPVSEGALTLDETTGEFRFDPAGQFDDLGVGDQRSVTAEVNLQDLNGASTPVTLSFTVTGTNDLPQVAVAVVTATVAEDSPSSVTGTIAVTDLDSSDTLSFAVSQDVAEGVFTLDADSGAFSFSPGSAFQDLGVGNSRTVSATVTVSDSQDATVEQLLEFTVTGTNDQPIVTGGPIDLNSAEDSADSVTGQIDVSDLDIGDTLTFSIVDPVAQGVLSLEPSTGAFSFSPAGDFQDLAEGETRTVAARVQVADGEGGLDFTDLTFTVTGSNDAPVVGVETLPASVIAEDAAEPITGRVDASDIDTGDILSFTLLTDVDEGAVSLDAATGAFSFSPGVAFQDLGLGQTRTVSAAVQVSDANGLTAQQTLVFTVVGTNDAPDAFADDIPALSAEGAPVGGTITATDIDGDAVLFTLTGDVSAGTLTLDETTGQFSFDPTGGFEALAPGETQQVTAQVTISDGQGGTAVETLSFTVVGQGSLPPVSEDAGGAVEGQLVPSDPGLATSDPVFTLVADTPDGQGTVSVAPDGSFSFDPGEDFQALGQGETASVEFVVAIDDGNGTVVQEIKTITVTGENDAPSIQLSEVETTVGPPLDIAAFGDLVLRFDATEAGGVQANGAGRVSQVNDLSTSAQDHDGTASGSRQSLLVQGEQGINGQPALLFDGVDDILSIPNSNEINTGNQVDERTFNIVFETGDDVDTRQVLFEEGGNVRGLNIYIDEGRLYFNAYNTTGSGTFDPIFISTEIEPGEAYAVTFVFDALSGSIEGFVNGESIGSAAVPDGVDTHSGAVALGGVAANTVFHDGVVASNDGFFFNGKISQFSIINDVLDDDQIGAVQTDALARFLNAAPTSTGFGTDIPESGAFSGTLTGTDVDGDSLTFAIVEDVPAGQGSLVLNADGSFVFDPLQDFDFLAPGESQEVSFTASVTDPFGAQSVQEVVFTVIGENDAPVAEAATVTGVVEDGGAISATLSATDAEGDALTFAIAQPPSEGSVTILDAAAGTVSFDPGSDFQDLGVGESRSVSFDFSVTDGQGGITTNSATVTVSGRNDAPVIAVAPDLAGLGDLVLRFDASEAGAIRDGDGDGTVSLVDLTANDLDTVAETAALASINGAPAVRFDNGPLQIPSSSLINSSDVSERTINLAFQTGDNVTDRQVLYEEGGGTRGFNIYIDNGELYVNAYNLESSGEEIAFGPLAVSTGIAEDTAYAVSLVFDNGTITGILNGDAFGSVSAPAGTTVFAHGDPIGLGGVQTGTVFSVNGSTEVVNGGGNSFTFQGAIGAVSIFNSVLSEPALDTVQNDLIGTFVTPTDGFAGSLDEDAAAFTGQIDVFDIDGDPVSLELVAGSGPDAGSLTVNADGSFTFAPGSDFDDLAEGDIRTISFQVRAQDGQGGTDVQTVSLNVTGRNDAPVVTSADPGSVSTGDAAGTAVAQVEATDIDSPGPLSFGIVGGSGAFTIDAAGQITLADPALLDPVGTPVEQVAVAVSDGSAQTTVPVAIDVTEHWALTPAADQATAVEDAGPVTLDLLGNDVGADLEIITVTQPNEGTVLLAADGSVQFDPGAAFQDLAEGQSRTVSFTYTVRDSVGLTADETATVTVTGTNDLPIITGADSGQVSTGDAVGTVVAQISASDADSTDTLSFAIVGGSGAFAVGADGQILLADPTLLDPAGSPVAQIEVAVFDGTGQSHAFVDIEVIDPVVTAPADASPPDPLANAAAAAAASEEDPASAEPAEGPATVEAATDEEPAPAEAAEDPVPVEAAAEEAPTPAEPTEDPASVEAAAEEEPTPVEPAADPGTVEAATEEDPAPVEPAADPATVETATEEDPAPVEPVEDPAPVAAETEEEPAPAEPAADPAPVEAATEEDPAPVEPAEDPATLDAASEEEPTSAEPAEDPNPIAAEAEEEPAPIEPVEDPAPVEATTEEDPTPVQPAEDPAPMAVATDDMAMMMEDLFGMGEEAPGRESYLQAMTDSPTEPAPVEGMDWTEAVEAPPTPEDMAAAFGDDMAAPMMTESDGMEDTAMEPAPI